MSEVSPAEDARFMAAALAMGRWGSGRTAPNPSVGAVIVRHTINGPVIVGLGCTADGGRPHAERIALRQAGDLARGSTVYVTLEPCSHFGRTPPCADALIAAGVARVVIGTDDPNRLVAGDGIARLNEVGIEVLVGVRGDEARHDLAGHITRMTAGRPLVTLKLAVSADGGIGRKGEGQLPISGPISRRMSHVLRLEHDAIAVGVDTVLADDPQLTCRLPGLEAQSPARIVFDRTGRLNPDAAMFAASHPPVIVVHGPEATAARRDLLSDAGAELIEAEGLADALGKLAARGFTTMLLEGGARLASSFAADDLIDRAVWIEAPVTLGGDRVVPFDGRGIATLEDKLRPVARERFDDDLWTTWERRA